ncbi:MAG: TRAP transporter TAXI family solute receptor [Rhodothermales bacterium]|jgi:TRAP transporter TAXI family solute receptor
MRVLSLLFSFALVVLIAGCGKDKPADAGTDAGGDAAPKKFISIGSAPTGGTFFIMGGAFEKVINESDIGSKATNESTKGSRENIIRLNKQEIDFGMSNAAITYFAVRGESDWKEPIAVRSVITMAPNVAQFITTEGSGINGVADLKGKRVYVGPAGAGFNMFLEPILTAHGIAYTDFTPINGKFSDAVGFLQDKQIDAAFLGGAVPTPAIVQASSSLKVSFVPYDADAKAGLLAKYPFFGDTVIPADKYTALTEDFPGMNVGYMHLITHENVDEETVYQITKTLYENREKVVAIHPAGKAINPKNAVRQTGTPFHPGAIRYYKEAGIWQE